MRNTKRENNIFISNSEAETVKLGIQFAERLKHGDTVAFLGDLGVGKTAFTRGICEYFGERNTCSPTFTIVNEYESIYHIDAYRITEDDWINSGFDEYLFDGKICIIEWAENLMNILPENTIFVKISKDAREDDCYRLIEISD